MENSNPETKLEQVLNKDPSVDRRTFLKALGVAAIAAGTNIKCDEDAAYPDWYKYKNQYSTTQEALEARADAIEETNPTSLERKFERHMAQNMEDYISFLNDKNTSYETLTEAADNIEWLLATMLKTRRLWKEGEGKDNNKARRYKAALWTMGKLVTNVRQEEYLKLRLLVAQDEIREHNKSNPDNPKRSVPDKVSLYMDPFYETTIRTSTDRDDMTDEDVAKNEDYFQVGNAYFKAQVTHKFPARKLNSQLKIWKSFEAGKFENPWNDVEPARINYKQGTEDEFYHELKTAEEQSK